MAAFALCLAALPAAANEAQIRKALEGKIGDAQILGASPSVVPGLWEVRIRGPRGVEIYYVDPSGRYLISGDLHELKSQRNLTAERVDELNAIKFASLPFDQAIKIQRGKGERVLAMFSDPYCPACRQFEQVLQQVDNITIYVFMYPVIRPELADHSRAIWCSPDRAKAWLDLALRGQRPTSTLSCETPVEKNVELGQTYRVNSTPTLVFPNGRRVAGGLKLADLQKVLDQAGRRP